MMLKMISKEDCVVGNTYEIKSRNLVVGVWTGEGFVGIREKFGSEFLFVEFHWDDGPPFGTVRPIAVIEECPVKDLREGWPQDGRFLTNRPLFDYLKPIDEQVGARHHAQFLWGVVQDHAKKVIGDTWLMESHNTLCARAIHDRVITNEEKQVILDFQGEDAFFRARND